MMGSLHVIAMLWNVAKAQRVCHLHALPKEPSAEPCLPVRSKANAILGKAEHDKDVPHPVVTIAIVTGRSLAWAVYRTSAEACG
jgi:hypothetical protein